MRQWCIFSIDLINGDKKKSVEKLWIDISSLDLKLFIQSNFFHLIDYYAVAKLLCVRLKSFIFSYHILHAITFNNITDCVAICHVLVWYILQLSKKSVAKTRKTCFLSNVCHVLGALLFRKSLYIFSICHNEIKCFANSSLYVCKVLKFN